MIIVTFDKTRDAIQAEKLCKTNEIAYKIIPVPRSVSAKCGMAVEIDDKNKEVLLKALDDKGIESRNYDKADVKL